MRGRRRSEKMREGEGSERSKEGGGADISVLCGSLFRRTDKVRERVAEEISLRSV